MVAFQCMLASRRDIAIQHKTSMTLTQSGATEDPVAMV